MDVVVNRVNSVSFPDTLCGVVKQRGAFEWYSYLKDTLPSDESLWVVSTLSKFSSNSIEQRAMVRALEDASLHYILEPGDITGNSLYYMTLPALNSHMGRTIVSVKISAHIGSHVFFNNIKWR